MQKVRYRLSSNSLYIKFQLIFHSSEYVEFSPFLSQYFLLSKLSVFALEVESPMFSHIITFYNLLLAFKTKLLVS